MSEEQKSLGQVGYEALQEAAEKHCDFSGDGGWVLWAELDPDDQSDFEAMASAVRAESIAREIEAAADKGIVA